MPSRVNDAQLGQAVFQHVETGAYPEDEQIISADLPSSALESLSEILERARADVKTNIRELSKLSAPDVDGWISQAKQLQGDIQSAESHAQEIVTLAEDGKRCREATEDAASKVELLKGEVSFNGNLARTLDQIHQLTKSLHASQQCVIAGQFSEAVALLQDGELQFSKLHGCGNTKLADLCRDKIVDIHNVLNESLTELWNALIHVDTNTRTVSIQNEIDGSSAITNDSVIKALDDLDLLRGKILVFRKVFDNVILSPRFHPKRADNVESFSINGGTINVSGRLTDSSTERLFADINAITEYLSTNLPAAVAHPLAEVLIPNLISRLLTGPLSSSVPSDIAGIPAFQTTLGQALAFAKSLDAQGLQGRTELVRWADAAPKVWLTRRSESTLHSMRQLLMRGLGNPRTVERIETQMVTRKDDMFVNNNKNEDWDAEWSDDGNSENPLSTSPTSLAKSTVPKHVTNSDDEGGDAWGLEDDESERKAPHDLEVDAGVEDGAEAWGWGDGEDSDDTNSRKTLAPAQKATPVPKSNGHTENKAPAERQITLKETYNITALPEQILEIIIQIVEDADTLSKSDSTSNPVALAASGLFNLPGVILTMYRASAPNFYASNVSGNMYLYNDSLYLAEQLRGFSEHHRSRNTSHGKETILDLGPDIFALEFFGKRAYGKEMESQRTILGDLLDGAQGFANCTEHPFAQECELAVSSSVDRLREVHAQWASVLSRSALLQSIGSLLATVTNKMIVDIEDMSDISEPESQRLSAFCNRIAGLEDLFLPEQPVVVGSDTEPPIPLTAIYTPSWLKFQYLTNILESSLVDIKYLWTEGELSLEFGPEELIDLIEALFADSEHRRKAIVEIRRGS